MNQNSLKNLKPAKPGECRNPGGKPVGARNRLQGKFLNQLADDFERHGKEAIAKMREKDPAAYIRAIASLMPTEHEIKRPLDEISDDELRIGVDALQRYIATQRDAAGTQAASELESTPGIQTVQ